MRLHGEYRPDGSFIGFDYQTQAWIDTRQDAERDSNSRPGSASNPLAEIPQRPEEGTP